MKDWMSWHHHGAIHMPHPMHWVHEKRIDLMILLIGLITLLFIGMAILGNHSALVERRAPEAYPGSYPQELTYP